GRACPDGLLLRGTAFGHHGRRLAVHRHRCLLGLPLGAPVRHPTQPLGPRHEPARPGGGGRSGRAGMEAWDGELRQWLGVHEPPVRGGASHPRGRPPAYPRGPAAVQRLRGWRPAFARYLTPKLTGLRRDLEAFLAYYG